MSNGSSLKSLMHHVRVLVHDGELAVVVGERHVDPAQVARPGRILDHLQMRVPGLGDQLLEDRVALDLGYAEQFSAESAVQFIQRGGQILLLRLVGRRCPPLGRGEVEVARDRIIDGVEQVLQVPPGDADRAHDRPLRN
jgi:hypothetical protein